MSPKKQTGKLALCPEVGIRSLKDLTKDELIYCINAAAIDECRLKWALQDIADKRQKKKWQKEDAAMAQYRKLLEELVARTGETAAFYVRRGEQRLCLYRVDSPHLLRMHVRVGDALPLDNSGIAQVLRAFSPRPLPAYVAALAVIFPDRPIEAALL